MNATTPTQNEAKRLMSEGQTVCSDSKRMALEERC